MNFLQSPPSFKTIDLSLCRIEIVRPETLQRWWILMVRRGVETIIKKTQPDWIAEDIYAKVVNQQAAIYVLHYDDAALGFTVATIQPRLYGDKKDLVVWCGWALPLPELRQVGVYPEDAVALEDYLMDHMKQVAIQSKCHSVYIYSPRPGMEKRAAKWGFKKGLVRYDLEVANG